VDAVRAVLDAGRRVIIQGETPADVGSPNLLTIGAVDHRTLFARTAVVVHHAGAGTTHAACRAGTPSVTVPQVGDQRYWADRLRRLGVAPAPLTLRDLSATALAERILDAAADRGMRDRAQALGNRLRAEDGLGTSVRVLEAAVQR
jgi:sterol 3beta-glucosyltransferase